MSVPEFPSALLEWYSQHARDLPWRNNPNPYAVWVSEIMLQQTRVETVIPYFKRWMETFPTIASLAIASQQEVLSAWEGLGYYGRARNLHHAAQTVMAEWGGKLPRDFAALRRLPGVGRYTAGAIASIAFGLDTPALDGNIRRVLARLFDVAEPLGSPAAEKRFWELVASNLPPGKAANYNQALMDLGALICTPRQPDCPHCPLRAGCAANASGLQAERPIRLARPQIPHHTVTAAVIRDGCRVLIAQRPTKGLLGGLWEFPGGKQQPGEDLVPCLQREICEELGTDIIVKEKLGVYKHAYTHFRVTLHAFQCQLQEGARPRPIQVQDLRWVDLAELGSIPMGKIDRQIARLLLTEEAAC